MAVSLENLASVLETGQDCRVFDRPMLGINVGDFTSEQAKQLGVPVKTGVRLDSVVPGLGAHNAGLTRNDVLVSLGGTPLSDFDSLVFSLRGKKGGEKVEVVYRARKENRSMEPPRRPYLMYFRYPELSGRRARFDESLAALAKTFEGYGEEAFHPSDESGVRKMCWGIWCWRPIYAQLLLIDAPGMIHGRILR
jgi:hypothetical protein